MKRLSLLLCGLVIAAQPIAGFTRDGQHDFDFHIGTWKTHLIFVRFVISDITPNSCRFEQSFSDDGGKTWELNWIAVDTRVKSEP